MSPNKIKRKKKKERSTDWWLENNRGDVKHGMGRGVNNAVMITHGTRWVLDLPRGSLRTFINV